MLVKNIKWIEPLKFAQKIADNYCDQNWIFLYSALNLEVKKSCSYVALFPKKQIITDDFQYAKKLISNDSQKWFGYLSYELGGDFEKLPKTKNSIINLPKIWLMNFSLIFEFNHDKKTLKVFFDDAEKLDEVLKYKALKPVKLKNKVKNLNSNFSDFSYQKEISNIKKRIADGDFYQTNLTRKFFGEFSHINNQRQNFTLFKQLTQLSPANYAAFIKLDKNYIISSSPELFLTSKNNKILSRPIKGTAGRANDEKQDLKNKLTLQKSIKERAENLMIVDLVRNDLARICEAGSVVVKKLFHITSYKTIHHMSSEIYGKIKDNYSVFDAIKSCFPAGSMTGAPKIKAMEVAAGAEKFNRGIYSGAIGYLSATEINMSVVIRTLIIAENKFEFQVGGAITFDSVEKLELEEIFNKATGIINLLQVKKRLFKPLK